MTRRVACAGLVVGTLLLAGCGVPTHGTESIEDDDVPYNLLIEPFEEPGDTVPTTPDDALAFWVNEQGLLVPRTTPADCSAGLDGYLRQVLSALSGGPTEADRADGLSTAVPPDARVELITVDDGQARIDLATPSPIGADRLPLAVAQIVLTLTSAPGLTEVTLYDDGQAVPVPVADGALTSTPVTAAAYADLVPDRYRDQRPFAPGTTGSPC